MQITQQILFIACLSIAAWLIGKRIITIKKTIQIGKAENRSDYPTQRLQTMLRIAFGQKKMFDRPVRSEERRVGKEC